MPRPNLIHPVDVIFEFVDSSELVEDADAREPVFGSRTLGAATSTEPLPAQVKWIGQDDPEYEGTGATEQDKGWLTMRDFDIDEAGVTIKRGTKITAIGHMTGLVLFVTKKEPCGHYPDQLGASLWRFYFSDRKPAAQE